MMQTNTRASSSARHCPRCGQFNQCALSVSQATGQAVDISACWCSQASWSHPLPELKPQTSADVSSACYCPTCLALVWAQATQSNPHRPEQALSTTQPSATHPGVTMQQANG